MRPSPLHLIAAWRADVETARRDLEATRTQAFVVAAHALAWRMTVVTLPVALLVAGVLVLRAQARPSQLLLAAALAVLGPQFLAGILTFPAQFFAMFQTFYRGTRGARLRFGVTSFAFNYYGWRYAFRGRQRSWGALTRDEQLRTNPERFGVDPAEP